MNSATFRGRYVDFLRVDFPQIPFAADVGRFENLSALGWALVQAQLLRDLPRRGLAKYRGNGDHEVKKPRYTITDEAIWINEAQYFAPVPLEVWECRIGGYQVLDKYLKSRKGRKLSLDEVTHFGTVADALAFTIEQMAQIMSPDVV